MRILLWKPEISGFGCSDCGWIHPLYDDSNEPAEDAEMAFSLHECELNQFPEPGEP